jgi:hypothetical protein
MQAKAVQEGVRDAMDFWLSQHPVSMGDLMESSIQKAVAEWLDAHADELTEAIAKAVSNQVTGEEVITC